MTTTATPELNGNPHVNVPHVFVPGKGCYFETREMAIHQGVSRNGVGLWVDELEFAGKTYFKAGNTNVWD